MSINHYNSAVMITGGQSMTPIWITIPLFLASASRDIHTERDELNTVVFPTIPERLNPRRCLGCLHASLPCGAPDHNHTRSSLNPETPTYAETVCRQVVP